MQKILSFFFLFFSLQAIGQPFVVTNGNDIGAGSLRKAVTDASNNPGPDQIIFNGNFQVNLLSEIRIDDLNPLTITGNGIGNTIIDGGLVTRIFYSNGNSPNITIASMTIQNGVALPNTGGGAISATATSLTINSVKFYNNTASISTSLSRADGGAISCYSGLTLSINSSFFENNSVSKGVAPNIGGAFGGAISALGGSSLDIRNTVFTNNFSGGGETSILGPTGHGGAIYSTGTLAITDCSFSGNKASFDGTNYYPLDGTNANGNGGAVYSAGNLTLNGACIFQNNGAGSSGGAIYKKGAVFATTGLTTFTVTGNRAGMADEKNPNVTLAKSGSGGGIFTDAPLTLTGANNVTLSDNFVLGGGGAINSAVSLTLDGVRTITRNYATVSGGAIAAGGSVLLKDVTISDNKGGYNGVRNKYFPIGSGYGGGGFQFGGTSLILQGNIVFERNTVSGYGGAIYYVPGASPTLNVTGLNSLIISENACFPNDTTTAVTSVGGGIATKSDITLTAIDSIYIRNNSATATQGGGFYVINAAITVNLSRTSITGNRSTTGGGIYSSALATLSVTNSNISNNTANATGGGINTNGTATITNVKVIGNTAKSSGGGIFAGAILTLNNCNISDNKAGYDAATSQHITGTYRGGGIYAGGALTLSGNMIFQRNTVGGNTNTTGGGGIYAGNTFNAAGITSLVIDQNTAISTAGTSLANSSVGGGIYASASTPLTLVNTLAAPITLSNNFASGKGGGIFADNTLSLKALTILRNRANDLGGGLYKSGSAGTTSLIQNTFDGNIANVDGGGLYSASAAQHTITNNTFSQNSATTGNGGAIYSSVNGALINTYFTTFNGNTAGTGTNKANAIYFSNATGKVLNGNIIYGNGSSNELYSSAAIAGNYNVVRSSDFARLTGTGNKGLDPGMAGDVFSTTAGDMATLANNGGITQTLNIKNGGPAHNLVPLSTSGWGVNTDQRSLSRPLSCGYDAGAVEIQAEDPAGTYTLTTPPLFVCGNTSVDVKTLYTTANIKDTAYFEDAAYTQPIAMPINVVRNTSVYVQFTSTSNCVSQDVIQIQSSLPTATFVKDTTICSGKDASLKVDFTGVQPFNLTYKNPTGALVSLTGINSNTYRIPVTNPTADSTYTLISVSDANACPNNTFAIASSIVHVNSLPVVSVSPLNPSTTVGVSMQLTGTPSSGGTGTWVSNDPAIATISSGGGLVTGVTVGNTDISYTFTDANGCANSSEVNVLISSTVPLTLLQFGVTTHGSGSLLTWTTTNEINTAYFDVEYSTNGTNFIKIGTVQAAGNSNTEKHYRYEDLNISRYNSSKLYYRLRQVDIDGSYTCSPIRRLSSGEQNVGIQVYPNPFEGVLSLSFPFEMSGLTQISLVDMNGRVVYHRQVLISSANQSSLMLSGLSNLAKGAYALILQNDQGIKKLKVIKK